MSGDDRLRLVLILLFAGLAAAVLGGPVALTYALAAYTALALVLLAAVGVRRLHKGGARCPDGHGLAADLDHEDHAPAA